MYKKTDLLRFIYFFLYFVIFCMYSGINWLPTRHLCPPVLLNECSCCYIFLSLGCVAILATWTASALGSLCLGMLDLGLVFAAYRAAPLLGGLGRRLSRLVLDLVFATYRAAPLLGRRLSRCLGLVFAAYRAAPLLGGLGRGLSRLRSMEIIDAPCNPQREDWGGEGGGGEGVGSWGGGSHVGAEVVRGWLRYIRVQVIWFRICVSCCCWIS